MPLPPDRLMRLKEVLDLTGLRRATLYRKIRTGNFPRQVRISERCAAWRDPPSEAGWPILQGGPPAKPDRHALIQPARAERGMPACHQARSSLISTYPVTSRTCASDHAAGPAPPPR
jgi:predicted DNA-binding transcriptional regulator AlpA